MTPRRLLPGIRFCLSLLLSALVVGCGAEPDASSLGEPGSEGEARASGHQAGRPPQTRDPLLAAAGRVAGEVQPAPAPDGSTPFLLSADLPDAISVLQAIAGAPGQEVTIVGRLQSKVKGRAMFHLVDDSVKDCTRSGCDSCPTPWDYCCHEKEMQAAIMLVELRGEDGLPVKVPSLGVRELDLVVVKGILAKGEGGRLMLLAKDGWHRRDRPKVSARVKFPA